MNWRETKTRKSEFWIMKLPPDTRKVIFLTLFCQQL